MKDYLQQALVVEMNPDDFDRFCEFAAEYFDEVYTIISDSDEDGSEENRWHTLLDELPPAKKLIYLYTSLLNNICADGFFTALLNASGKDIGLYREMIAVSESTFLHEQFEKAMQLFTKNYIPSENENFWSNGRGREDVNTFFDSKDMEEIEKIGNAIEKACDDDDVERAYYRLLNS